jgi:hypothetical protein
LLTTSFADLGDAMTNASVEEAKRQRDEAKQTLENQKKATNAFFG